MPHSGKTNVFIPKERQSHLATTVICKPAFYWSFSWSAGNFRRPKRNNLLLMVHAQLPSRFSVRSVEGQSHRRDMRFTPTCSGFSTQRLLDYIHISRYKTIEYDGQWQLAGRSQHGNSRWWTLTMTWTISVYQSGGGVHGPRHLVTRQETYRREDQPCSLCQISLLLQLLITSAILSNTIARCR